MAPHRRNGKPRQKGARFEVKRKRWDYTVLIPLFKASGLKSLDYFKKMIRDLERVIT